MKIMKQGLFLITLSLLCIGCQKNDKLIGQWERFGDKFAGMKVQVIKEGESFRAMIVFATDSCKMSGFVERDIKWKNIKKIIDNKYEFEDLSKIQVSANKFDPSYVSATIEFISDNELYIRLFSKGTEEVGTEQKWKRISNK